MVYKCVLHRSENVSGLVTKGFFFKFADSIRLKKKKTGCKFIWSGVSSQREMFLKDMNVKNKRENDRPPQWKWKSFVQILIFILVG